jgi:hypothetical protein
MGTQQILLIVLSVIIVGVAVVAGIAMFNTQSYNSNKQQVASDLVDYGSLVMQWWMTPPAQGGAGERIAYMTDTSLAAYIGFNGDNNSFFNPEVGEFRLTATTPTDTTVTLVGLGIDIKSGNHPKVTTVVDLTAGTVSATVEDAATF